jgi:aspartyl-tRNA(Asn)/glutamyl-tRNA(Gln) amidotransferase subunit A
MGPIADCVDDLKLMFAAMSDPALKFTDERPLASPPRMGLLESWFLEKADRSVVDATRAALARLRSAGAILSVVALPDSFQEVHTRHRILMAAGAAHIHREQFAAHSEKYGREIATLIREGLGIDQETFRAALEHQQRFRQDMSPLFTDVDVLVTPATPTPAPTVETTGDPKFNSPWSYSGLPTVSLPCSISEDGLPLSLQLIGPGGSENRLLTVAAWIEDRLAFDRRSIVGRN